MFDVYFWTTPNGYKITILLEELGWKYNVIPVRIGKGEQFSRFPRDRPEQQDPGDGRSRGAGRQADRTVRVRRYHDVPRGEKWRAIHGMSCSAACNSKDVKIAYAMATGLDTTLFENSAVKKTDE